MVSSRPASSGDHFFRDVREAAVDHISALNVASGRQVSRIGFLRRDFARLSARRRSATSQLRASCHPSEAVSSGLERRNEQTVITDERPVQHRIPLDQADAPGKNRTCARGLGRLVLDVETSEKERMDGFHERLRPSCAPVPEPDRARPAINRRLIHRTRSCPALARSRTARRTRQSGRARLIRC